MVKLTRHHCLPELIPSGLVSVDVFLILRFTQCGPEEKDVFFGGAKAGAL